VAAWVNLIAGFTQVALSIAVAVELIRMRRGFPRVAILLISFFLVGGIALLNRPDPLIGHSDNLDAVLIVIDMVILLGLLLYVRVLVRNALRTVDEAKLRRDEYERARRDYGSLLRHRIANPLTTIEGAARTLVAGRGDEESREQLLETIIDASRTLEQISIDPKLESPAEAGLEPVPWLRFTRSRRRSGKTGVR
jgi:signal transduction histidine kinase